MYNTSLRIVNDTEEAEDIMQESFLTAFRKLGDYTGEGSFGGWLRRIVVNNSVDALKRRKETISIDDFEPGIYIDGGESHEEEDYVVEEIHKSVSLLKNEDRLIISLYLFEGYDHEEIAGILNLTNNATRTRYSRAKARLLSILAKNRVTRSFVNPN